MKRIDAFVELKDLEDIRDALQRIGVSKLVMREVQSVGYTIPRQEVYRGSRYVRDTAGQLEITAIVDDAASSTAVAAIRESVRHGEIFVSAVDGHVHV